MLSITSTVPLTNTVVPDAARPISALPAPEIAGPGQASNQAPAPAPKVAVVTDDLDVWMQLRKRLDALIDLDNVIAQVCRFATSLRAQPPHPSRPFRHILTLVWHGEWFQRRTK